MSNGGGCGTRASFASQAKQMAAFDGLPRMARDKLNNAAFAWAPYPLHRYWKRGYFNVNELCALIDRWDREQLKQDRA
jgi:hypothetical protein